MTNQEEPQGPAAQEAELRRQRRLVDQNLTMQARLRDRAQVTGTVLVCTILVASVVGVAFAFANTSVHVTLVGVTADRSTWLGWLAVVTASLTLVELVLDRRGAAQRRSEAVKALAVLKAEYRTRTEGAAEVERAVRLSERYAQVMDTIPAVPESAFNRLKAAHLRKVEVSKVISEYPGISALRARHVVSKRYRRRGKSSPN